MAVGLDFCIANSLKEAAYYEESLKFDEDLQSYLREKEGYPAKKYGLLLDLDQYENKLFTANEIKELMIICESIVKKYSYAWGGYRKEEEIVKEIWAFALALKSLCSYALETQKRIAALGD